MENRVENVKARLLAVTAVTVRDEKGELSSYPVAGKGIVSLQVQKESLGDVKTWLRDWCGREKWRGMPIALDLRKWYRKATNDQKALLFSLCGIMALDEDGKRDQAVVDGYYYGLLQLYAPRVQAIMPDGTEGAEAIKTASQMTTVELSLVVEGTFRELMMKGVGVDKASKIKNWYLEWRTWRGKLKHDGLEDTYKNLEDYRQRVSFCEATLHPLPGGEGHLAHILSKGAHGPTDDPRDYLHLCAEVHGTLQHTKGWVEMLETYPHLMGKVNGARRRHGMPTLKGPKDLYEDIVVDPEEPAADKKAIEQAVRDDADSASTEELEAAAEIHDKMVADSGKRRLFYHSESEAWYVQYVTPIDGLSAEVGDAETDEQLRQLLAGLVKEGSMAKAKAKEIAQTYALQGELNADEVV